MSPAELNTRSIPALDGRHEKIFSISEANLVTCYTIYLFKCLQLWIIILSFSVVTELVIKHSRMQFCATLWAI